MAGRHDGWRRSTCRSCGTSLRSSIGAEGRRTWISQGLRLHPLKGELKAHFAVLVSGNWRVTFRFEEGEAADVDYLDYH